MQWEGETYSDASSLERTPWVSAWPIADTIQETLSVHFSALCRSRCSGNENKAYQRRSKDV